MENNQQQPESDSSKAEKARGFRFSAADKAFLIDYFQNTNKAPRKKERQQILAHIKELGSTEAKDISIINWFNNRRRQDEKFRPSLLSAPAPELSERKWANAHHKALWPSLTKETLKNLELLYSEHLTKDEPPYDLWAEGLGAKHKHVLMWCKFKERERDFESARQSRPNVPPITTSISQEKEGHSQLPTPGASISPEPHRAFLITIPPLSPNAVKHEPPASPVVDTTRFQQQPCGPAVKSSMGLHAAIESAFSAPLHAPLPFIQPPKPSSAATQINHQRKASSSRNPSRTIDVIPPPAPPPISSTTTTSASASLPSVSISRLPSNPGPSPPPSHHEPPTPPLPEEPIPDPPVQPARDIARERADLVTGIAAKVDEVTSMFSSVHGSSQLAGSIPCMHKRNQQFLDDVAAGRFAHMRLTSAYLPSNQAPSLMPEFNPQRVLAERRSGKGKGKEREEEDMDIDAD